MRIHQVLIRFAENKWKTRLGKVIRVTQIAKHLGIRVKEDSSVSHQIKFN